MDNELIGTFFPGFASPQQMLSVNMAAVRRFITSAGGDEAGHALDCVSAINDYISRLEGKVEVLKELVGNEMRD